MQTWQHVYVPLGNLWLSSVIAAIPISFFVLALSHPRLRSNDTGTLTVAPGFMPLKPALKS